MRKFILAAMYIYGTIIWALHGTCEIEVVKELQGYFSCNEKII